MAFLKVLFVAIALALDVFAVAIGVGLRGLDLGSRVRIGASFAVAEMGMSLLGLELGGLAGRALGLHAGYLGFAVLIILGMAMIVQAIRESERPPLDLSRGWGLLLAALSVSVDSLGVGFSIHYIGVPIFVTLVTIGVVSVLSTTIGITFGRLLGQRIEASAELLAGVALVIAGAGFAVLQALGIA